MAVATSFRTLALVALLLLQAPLGMAQTAGKAACSIDELRQQLAPHFAQCPSNVMTLVIGYNPGGNTDTVGRHFQAYLNTVATSADSSPAAFSSIIESKPGASGEIGSRYVVDADPKTAACRLLVAQSNQMSTNKFGLPNAIDPETDLKPIALMGEAPLVLVVNGRTSPHKRFADFESYLKSGGSRAFYGSNGNFATDHLATETLLFHMGAKGTHVPFTGSAPMIANLLGGHEQSIDFGLLSVGLVRDYLFDGRLRALGVARPQDIRLARGAGQPDLVIEPIANYVPKFQYASMWVALAGNLKLPDRTANAMERAVQCFAQHPRAVQVLTKDLLFDLGGNRTVLRQRMQADISEARQRFQTTAQVR